MSVIIRLQNLPLSASSIDIRTFFRGLSIPDGGVHIVGGRDGDAFIAFSTDEDARQAMALSGNNLKDLPVKLLLSSRNEMFKIIEQARQRALGITPTQTSPQQQVPVLSQQNAGINSTNAAMQSQSNSMGTPSSTNTNNPQNTPTALDQQHPGMTPNTNGLPPNMSMPAFTAGHGMNLPGNMNPFATMKLPTGMTPQQLSSMMPGANMTTIFAAHSGNTAQQYPAPAPTNPFMLPNMSSAQGGVAMGFPGMMSNLMTQMPPGMQMPGVANQMLNPSISSTLPTSNNNGPTGNSLPGPFNYNMANARPNNMPGPAFGISNQQSSGQGFQGGQPVHSNMLSNPAFDNGHGPQAQGGQPRSAFNHNIQLQQPNMMSPHITAPQPALQQQPQLQQSQLPPRNRPNMNEGPKNGFQGGMGSRAGTGPPTSSGTNSDFGQGRDRGRDRDRGDRDKDLLPDRSRPERNRKRTPERRDSRGESKRRRSRERDNTSSSRSSRDARRPRSTKSRSRSRSRNRDRSERSSRPNSARDSKPTISVPAKIDSESRNSSSGNEPDLIIVEHIVAQEFACVKLSGVPKEASYRDLKDFIRADLRGGSEGVVRNSEEGIVFLRLERSVDLDKVLRTNGRKLCGATIRVEGIPADKYEEAKNSKRPSERGDRDRERERPTNTDRSDRDRDRDRDRSARPERVVEREPSRDVARDLNDTRGRDRDRSSGSKECCVVIRGLPPAYSGKDVAMNTLSSVKRFAYSDIHVHIEPVDMTGRNYATAYVKFISVYEAEKTIEMFKAQGLPINAEIHDVEELYRIRDGGNQPRPRGRSLEAQPLFDVEMESDITMVILKGVPPNMSERDVFDFFSDIGLSPINVRMLSDPHGNRNGQVLCEFQDPNQARRATTKDGMVFGRSTVSVALVPRKGAPGGEGIGGGNMRGSHRGGIMGNGIGHHGNFVPNPRFHGPSQQQSANPFLQEFIAQTQGMPGPVPHGGPRGRGGPRMRGGRGGGPPGHRPSRFTPADSGIDHGHTHVEVTPDHSFFERPDCVVAVTNIPFSASMDDILQFLGRTLSTPVPRDRIIRRYNEFKKPTGDARIAFPTQYEAQQALEELTGTVLWNRPLQVALLNDTL